MKKNIWIDTDLSVGMKRSHKPGYCDVDDGYAVWQLMQSDKVHIVGISSVFGNTSIDNSTQLSQQMATEFAPYPIPVFRGAGEAIHPAKHTTNAAVEALADALSQGPLHIMAIGPLTNVGLLLLHYPELASRIEEVVVVAGRRAADAHFTIGHRAASAPDLNFDLDNAAFELLFQHQVPLVFCPFEISNKVWLRQQELERLKAQSGANAWLAEHSQPWLQQWIEMGVDGFNPFDVLASHYLIAPQDLRFEALNARTEYHLKDDMENNPGDVYKRFLICDKRPGYPVLYCYDVVEDYREKLMQTLLNPH